MSSRAILVRLATASAALMFATSGSAAGFGGQFGGGVRMGMGSGGSHGASHIGGSSPRPAASFGHGGAEARMGMRSGGFHGASPNIGGSSPRTAASIGRGGAAAGTDMRPAGPRGAPGLGGSSPRGAPAGARQRSVGPGHGHGQFRGHSFDQFSADDRARWSHGDWRHGWRHGRYGSWWVVDGLWFFYDEPIYPYPAYVGWEDDGDSDASSYYCEDPPGYYPDVQACNVEWEAAPGE